MSKRGCLSIFCKVDDVTQAMSKGGVLVNCECSFTPPSVGRMTSRRQCPRGCVLVNVLSPPLQEILYPRLTIHVITEEDFVILSSPRRFP